MPKNIHILDRLIRYFVGIALLTWAIAGGPLWTLVGFALIATSSFGTCPIYWVFRINSRP